MMDNIQIARVCHEVNRAYCEAIGDHTQTDFYDSPDWQQVSAVKGVEFHLANPYSKPCDSHESWLEEKLGTGWRYGPNKNQVLKEHPCCVPYDELPQEQKVKDYLFLAVVRALEETRPVSVK